MGIGLTLVLGNARIPIGLGGILGQRPEDCWAPEMQFSL